MRHMFLGFVFLFAQTALADECENIRNALNELPPSGGEVIVGPGNYTCDHPIIMDRSNVILRGTPETFLRLADNSNSPLIIMGAIETPPRPVANISVVNLQLDGNRQHQQIECWGGPCDAGGKANIRNNGITVRGVTNGVIRNIKITSPRSGGVVSEKGCVNLFIDGLKVTDSQFDGFAGYETTGSVLSNMVLSSNLAAGISLDIRFHGNTIRDSILANNRDVGIFMRYADENLFENLKIENSGNHGVFVAEAEEPGTCPRGNIFAGLTVEHSKGYGFLLNNDCEGNRLVGKIEFRKNSAGCLREPSRDRLGRPAQFICEE